MSEQFDNNKEPNPACKSDSGAADADPESQAAVPNNQAKEALAAFEHEQREKAANRSGPSLWSRLKGMLTGFFTGFFQIRNTPSIWGKLFMVSLCLGSIFLLWYLASRPWWGPNGNERALSKITMGSPEEVFGSFGSLWFERAFMRNLLATLWLVFKGFGLAVLVGVPIGILCGTFRRIDAFFLPITIFGRNVPIVTLIPLTMLFFGLGDGQKVAFLFVACVAFIIFDSSTAVSEVSDDYLDTAYTLGASRLQVLTKVLIPLAMPTIVNSIRLMLGLAFGYIILAEAIDADYGVGKLIMMSRRRGPQEHVYLCMLILTLVAFLINYGLAWLQRVLFPYRYGRN